MEPVVDFFVIGAQKAGTTALASFLAMQTAIQMARIKEVHHFDDEDMVDWSSPNHDRLHRHFDWSKANVARGEATPIYMYWPLAMERILAYNPKARLIVGLRHPVYRAYSQWRMNVSRCQELLDFRSATDPTGRARLLDGSLSSKRLYSYIERSLYSRQISNVFKLFPRCQVHFYRTDHLWARPIDMVFKVTEFLQVPMSEFTSQSAVYISPYESKSYAVLADSVASDLNRLFIEDILATEQMIGVDLSDWRQPDYYEPMTPVSKQCKEGRESLLFES
jgi:hypothetical protein